MKTARFVIVSVSLFLLAKTSPAQLAFTLTPAAQSGGAGLQASFVGTLTNSSSTETLFLNDIHFDLTGAAAAALEPDSNVFFANVPGILLPNETFSGLIFTVGVYSPISPADYAGSVVIRGGNDIFAASDLLAQGFQVSSPIGLPSVAISANHLQLSFYRNASAVDITFIVEASSDLVPQTWSPIMTRAAGGNWIADQPGATADESGSGSVLTVTITDPIPIVDPNTSQPLPKRFLRVRLQR